VQVPEPPPAEAPEPPPAPEPPRPEPAAFEPPLDATIIARPEAREELVIVHDNQRTPIEGAVVQIGRAPGCDIVLDDRNVSRRHAEIRRRGPVVVLIDLDSTNGTIVNGRRVREHPLADGDRITLGNSRLTFERRTTA
jgi:pSer/pThr/pTyr-binding forkhead associated (FHA) protein